MKTGDSIKMQKGNWGFGGDVPKKFVSHAEKSIPFYHEGHNLVCEISDFFCRQSSLCYEIGASTGQLSKKLSDYNAHKKNITWVCLEIEKSMIDVAKKHCLNNNNINFIEVDATTFDFEKCDFISSYYAIQFIHPKHRQELINKIYSSLNWGGGFIWFEKVRAPDARFQDMSTTIYNDFKIGNGYNAEEILNKTSSLKGVMEPFSTNANIELLKRAGFVDITTVFKYVCFEGFLAIK